MKTATAICVRKDPPDRFIQQWVSLISLKYDFSNNQIIGLKKYVEDLYETYISMNRETNCTKEISLFRDSLIFRIAYITSETNRLLSFLLFIEVFRNNPQITLQFIPKYIFKILTGRKISDSIRNILHSNSFLIN